MATVGVKGSTSLTRF